MAQQIYKTGLTEADRRNLQELDKQLMEWEITLNLMSECGMDCDRLKQLKDDLCKACRDMGDKLFPKG
jgi:hypothetical protein